MIGISVGRCLWAMAFAFAGFGLHCVQNLLRGSRGQLVYMSARIRQVTECMRMHGVCVSLALCIAVGVVVCWHVSVSL